VPLETQIEMCSILLDMITDKEGTQWHSWTSHCATRWQVAISIPDRIVEILHQHYASGLK
jgi:hypothetical protein